MHKQFRQPTVTSVDEDDDGDDYGVYAKTGKHAPPNHKGGKKNVPNLQYDTVVQPFPFQQIMEEHPPFGVSNYNVLGNNVPATDNLSRVGRGGPPMRHNRFQQQNSNAGKTLGSSFSYAIQFSDGAYSEEVPYETGTISTSSSTKQSSFYVPSHARESPIVGLGKKIVEYLPQSEETKRKMLEEKTIVRSQEISQDASFVINQLSQKIANLQNQRREALKDCAKIETVLKKRYDRELYQQKMGLLKTIQLYDKSIRTAKIQLDTIMEGRQKIIDKAHEMTFKRTMNNINQFNKSMMESGTPDDIHEITEDIQELDEREHSVLDSYLELDTRSLPQFPISSHVNQRGEDPFAYIQNEIDGINETSDEEEERLGAKYYYDENNPSGDDYAPVVPSINKNRKNNNKRPPNPELSKQKVDSTSLTIKPGTNDEQRDVANPLRNRKRKPRETETG